jgi:hypothetical protein
LRGRQKVSRRQAPPVASGLARPLRRLETRTAISLGFLLPIGIAGLWTRG